MIKYKYKYSIDGYEFVEFESVWAFHPEHNLGVNGNIANGAAQHLFEEAHDQWPVKITIKTIDDKLIGKFIIDLMYVPKFTAKETK